MYTYPLIGVSTTVAPVQLLQANGTPFAAQQQVAAYNAPVQQVAPIATVSKKLPASIKPAVGTVQAVIFATCAANPQATSKQVAALLAVHGINANSASAGYRKYHNPQTQPLNVQANCCSATTCCNATLSSSTP